MASKSKTMKKAVSKEDLKRLMKEKQASKDNKTKVTHPLAKYVQCFIIITMIIATIGKIVTPVHGFTLDCACWCLQHVLYDIYICFGSELF